MLRTKNNQWGFRRKKGILLKIEDYRLEPKDVTTINGKHYIGASQTDQYGNKVPNKTYLRPVNIPYCAICGKPAEYTGIYDLDGAKRIERYCGPCPKSYGPIEDIKLKVVK